MVTVLVTRPRTSSENFAQELKRHGYEGLIEPMLSIEALATPMPDIRGIQAMMITSGNALEALEAGGHTISELAGFPCFCVGPRTAEKARAAGFRDVHSAAGDGTELAQLIGGTLEGKGGPVLHISGQDIDSKAQDELARLGHKVVPWPVYIAEPSSNLAEPTIRLLEQRKLDAIVVFSVRTAQVLKALLAQNALEACCAGLTAIGLSETVAEALKPLPWRKLAVAARPTEEAVIECLKQTNPVS